MPTSLFFYRPDFGLLLLRLFVGLRLLYGVVDNIISWKQMQEFAIFLQQFGFPFSIVSAVVSVWAQAICGLLILVGYKTRWASAVMVVNFLVAIAFVHLKAGDSVEATTPALALLVACACLLFTGAGRLSVEENERLKS